MLWNPSIHPSGLRETFETHLSVVESDWQPGPAADWSRDFLRRFRTEHADTVCLMAAGEMAESLADGERHGIATTGSDTYVSINTFPCGAEEARQIYYPDGYIDYLRFILPTARDVKPGCHFVHIQFFCDRRDCEAQLTLLANNDAFGGDGFCNLPPKLLSTEELRELGIPTRPGWPERVRTGERTQSAGVPPVAARQPPGREESASVQQSAKVHPSGLREILEAYLALVESDWPSGPAGDWARDVLRRLRAEQLEKACLLGAAKMAESLVDGEEHGMGLSESDTFVSVATFPCGVEAARRRYYPDGYFARLRPVLHVAREVNPGCHFVHIQFFCDRRECQVQFALIPYRDAVGSDAFYTLPIGFLTEEERRRLGIE